MSDFSENSLPQSFALTDTELNPLNLPSILEEPTQVRGSFDFDLELEQWENQHNFETILPASVDIKDDLFLGNSQILQNSREDALLRDWTDSREIVFIDETVTDVGDLITGINPHAEIIRLETERDGIEQISEVLAQRRDISGVHIVSHGRAGNLELGSTKLSQENIEQYGDALKQWGKALTEKADLLLYGCDVAEGEIGEAFVNRLSVLTGADVAASDDLTGNTAYGGDDWLLEYDTGNIETNEFSGNRDFTEVLGEVSYKDRKLLFDQGTGKNDISISFSDNNLIFSDLNNSIDAGEGVTDLDSDPKIVKLDWNSLSPYDFEIKTNKVTFASSLFLDGANLKVTSKSIKVNPGVTLSTRKISGSDHLGGSSAWNSGNINFIINETFGDGEIIIGKVGEAETQILTHAKNENGTNYTDGNINFAVAKDVIGSVVVDIDTAKSKIELNNTTIQGGKVDLIAIAGKAFSFNNQSPPQETNLIEYIQKAPLIGDAVKDLSGGGGTVQVGAGVVVADSTAEVLVNSSRIRAANVNILADAKATGKMNPLLSTSIGLGVGVGDVDSTARAIIDSTSTISVINNFTLKSSTKNELNIIAAPVQLAQYSGKGAGLAAGIAVTNSDMESIAQVSQGANVTVGALDVSSTSEEKHKVIAEGTAANMGRLGIAVAVSDSESTTKALVDGNVTSSEDIKISAESKKENSTTANSKIGSNFIDRAVGKIFTNDTANYVLDLNAGLSRKLSELLSEKLGNFDFLKEYGMSASVAVVKDKSDTVARIGDGAVVNSKGKININASAEITPYTNATAIANSASDPQLKDRTDRNYAGAGAIQVNNFDTTAKAYIGKNAIVDAQNSLSVTSDTKFPYDPSITAFIGEGVGYVTSSLPTLLGKLIDYGVDTFKENVNKGQSFTSWTRSAATGAKEMGLGVSVNVFNINNNSSAYIDEGAQINQNLTENSSVVRVKATSEVETVNAGGALPVPLIEAQVGQSDPVAGVGGTVLVMNNSNNVSAVIHDGVKLKAKTLEVDSKTAAKQLTIGVSGGKADTVGANGTVSVLSIDNNTIAQIDSGAEIVTGGSAIASTYDGIRVQATDDSRIIGITGGVALAKNVGIGFSVGVNDIKRNTQAVIGNLADSKTQGIVNQAVTGNLVENTPLETDTGGSVTCGRDISVNANNTGYIVSLALAGAAAVNTGSTTQAPSQSLTPSNPNGANSSQTNTSVFEKLKKALEGLYVKVSGEWLDNDVHDDTKAYIKNANIKTFKVDVKALNNTAVWALAGGFALNYNSGVSGTAKASVGITGSWSDNFIEGTTAAYLESSTATLSTDLNVSATTNRDLKSLAASASGVVNKGTTSLFSGTLAGSVTNNEITNQTLAYLKNTTLESRDLVVKAEDTSKILSGAGAIAVTLSLGNGSKNPGGSVGLSWADNEVASSTLAYLENSTVKVGEKIVISAENKSDISTLSAAIGITNQTLAVPASFSINDITNTTKAYIYGGFIKEKTSASNETNKTDSLSITAKDTSVINSIAGQVGIADKAAVGFAFAWNNIENKTNSYINAAQIDEIEGDILLDAQANSQILAIAAGGSKADKFSLGGSLSLNSLAINTTADIEGGAKVKARGNIAITANSDLNLKLISGAVGIAKGTAIGVGTTILTTNNNVAAYIQGATTEVNAKGNGKEIKVVNGEKTDRGQKSTQTNNGLIVVATNTDNIFNVAAAGALGADSTGLVAGAGSATVNIIKNTTKAYLDDSVRINQDSTDVSAAQSIYVFAWDDAEIVTIAGSASLSRGQVGVAGGVSVGVIDRSTTAYIGLSALVKAKNNIEINALNTNKIKPLALSLGAAKGAGIAGSADVLVINETTKAYISNNADVTANNNLVVEADSRSKINLVAGSIGGAGTVGVGVSAGIPVINKTTEAYIQPNARVTALGLGNGIAVSTGEFESQYLPIEPSTFNTQEVDLNANTIHFSQKHDFKTGDAVVFNQNSSGSVGGLTDKQIYYVVVVDDRTIKLKDSPNNNSAVDLTSSIAGGHILQFVEDIEQKDVIAKTGRSFASSNVDTYNNTITLGQNHDLITGQSITYSNAQGSPIGGLENGKTYYIIADRNNLKTFKLATSRVSAENGIAIDLTSQGSGSEHRLLFVRNGDSVTVPKTKLIKGLAVTATSFNDMTNVAAAGSGAGTAAVSLGGSLYVLNNTTKAYIDNNAQINQSIATPGTEQSVHLVAGTDLAHLGFGGGFAGSGTAAIGPGANVTVINNITGAYIAQSAKVNAAQDIRVEALAHGNILGIGASIAGSGAVAVAGSASVLALTNKTSAFIGQDTQVTAGNNVLVRANDDTEVKNYAGSLGVGLSVGGVGASAGVIVIEKDTQAYISDRAIVDAAANRNSTIDVVKSDNTGIEAIKGIGVQATSTEYISHIAASGSGGLYAGIAGALTVTNIDSDTTAYVGTNALLNQNNQNISSSQQTINITATNKSQLLTGAGSLAFGIVGIGGGVDIGGIQNNTTAYINDGSKVTAKKDVAVRAFSKQKVDTGAINVGVGGVGIAGSVSVYGIGAKLNGDANQAIKSSNGDTIQYADNLFKPSSSLTQLLNSYNNQSDLATLQGQVGTTGTTQLQKISSNNVSNALARQEVEGTTAFIGKNVTVTSGNNIDVKADGKLDFNALAGQASAGVVGVGGSVIVANINNRVNAYTDLGCTLEAVNDIQVNATTNEKVQGKSQAGQGGAISLGAAVSKINLNRDVRAFLANNTKVTKAKNLNINANTISDLKAEVGNLSGGGIVLGGTYAGVSSTGFTKAYLGDSVTVSNAQALNVKALSNDTVTINSEASTGGIIGGSGTIASATVTPTVEAYIGTNGKLQITSDATIEAQAQGTVTNKAGGNNVGLANAGISQADATWKPTVFASVGDLTELNATNITVKAFTPTNTNDNAKATAYPSNGSLIGGGVSAQANTTIDSRVLAYVGNRAKLTATNNLNLTADSFNQGNAQAQGKSYGLVLGTGSSNTSVQIINLTKATTAADVQLNAQNTIILDATSKNKGTSNAIAGTAGAISISGSNASMNLTNITTAELGNSTIINDGQNFNSLSGQNRKLIINANSTINLDTQVEQRADGVGTGNKVEGNTNVSSNTDAKVGEQAKINVNYFTLKANEQNVSLYTGAKANTLSIASDVEAKAIQSATLNTKATIGSKTKIIAPNGLNVSATQDLDKVSTYSNVDAFGIGPDEAHSTNILNATAEINADSTVTIERNLNINPNIKVSVTPDKDKFSNVASDYDALSGSDEFLTTTDNRFSLNNFKALSGLSKILVDNFNDTNDGNYSLGNMTLREAISQVLPGGIITFSNKDENTIVLKKPDNRYSFVASDPLLINKSLTIDGGNLGINISGYNTSIHSNVVANGLFTINSYVDVTISGLTLKNGYSSNGGAIYNDGNLTLRNVLIYDNKAYGYGGAIYNNSGTVTLENAFINNNTTTNGGGAVANKDNGKVIITNSRFWDNKASTGGAIWNGGYNNNSSTINITNSYFKENSATSNGGAIYANDGIINISQSSLFKNSAASNGGAIYNSQETYPYITNTDGAIITLSQVTISGNSATSYGGGIYANSRRAVNIRNSTITNNTSSNISGSGSGILNYGSGGILVLSSIIAGNANNRDVDGTSFSSENYNLIGGGNAVNSFGQPILDKQQDPMDAIAGTSTSYTFIADSLAKELNSTSGNGLPNDGYFAANTDHPIISLGYGKREDDTNAIQVVSQQSVTHTLAQTEQKNYKTLHLLATSAQGKTGVEVQLTYSDGSVSTVQRTTPDWFDDPGIDYVPDDLNQFPEGVYTLFNDADRVETERLSTSNGLINANDAAIFGLKVSVDPAKTLQKITVINQDVLKNNQNQIDPSNLFVFGMTAVTQQEQVVQLDISALFNRDIIANKFNRDLTNVTAAQLKLASLPTVSEVEPYQYTRIIPSYTHTPLAGSPAIDGGSNPDNLQLDQNKRLRVAGTRVDIGAVESPSSVLVVDVLTDVDDGNYSAGNLSLREAIYNSASGATITFNPRLANSTIALNEGELVIGRNLTIDGGNENITISGLGKSRIFSVDDRDGLTKINVVLKNLNLTEGLTTGNGGAIYNGNEDITIVNSNIFNNRAFVGGGIYSDYGKLNLSNTAVYNNQANSGGGIWAYGEINVSNSTISSNIAANNGGGIDLFRANGSIRNSTITNNVAKQGAGIIASGNSEFDKKTINLSSTIISGNINSDLTEKDYYTFVSNGYNLFGNKNFSSSGRNQNFEQATDITGKDPKLAPLADNGGKTKTHALLSGSPAIDAGNNPTSLTTDQRGAARVSGEKIDIGAHEADNQPPTLSLENQVDVLEGTIVPDGKPLKVADIILKDDDGVGGNNIALAGNDANKFVVISETNNGVTKNYLALQPGTVLNYEEKNQLQVTIKINDLTIKPSVDASITYELNIGDRTPTLSLQNQVTELAETHSISEVLGEKVAEIVFKDEKPLFEDEPISDKDSLFLTGPDANKFELVQESGLYIALKPGTVLDYETKSPLEVTVNVDASTTDKYPDSSVQYNLNIIDRNDEPTISLQNTVTLIPQSFDKTQKVADILITDDALGTNNLTLVGADADLFEIKNNSLYLKADINLDALKNPKLDVEVVVNDPEFSFSNRASLSISITTDSLVVNTLNDEDNNADSEIFSLSFREALQIVDDGGTISFAPNLANQTLQLTRGQLFIDKSVTIVGNSITLVAGRLDLPFGGAEDSGRIFKIDDGENSVANVILENLNLTKGQSDEGSAIYNQENLTLTDSKISDNRSTFGAIYNQESLTINNSNIQNNLALGDGGAIYNQKDLTINNSQLFGNQASNGGAIYNNKNLTITNSDIRENESIERGSGIYNQENAIVSNSNIRNNRSNNDDGAIYNNQNLTINNSSLYENSGGAIDTTNGIVNLSQVTITRQNEAISVDNSEVNISNSTIVYNGSLDNSSYAISSQNNSSVKFASSIIFNLSDINGSTFISQGHNLFSSLITDTGFTTTPTDILYSGYINLGNLAYHGGRTKTFALSSGNPAIDAGSNPNNLTTDQRGEKRVSGTQIDIGAYEAANQPPTLSLKNQVPSILEGTEIPAGEPLRVADITFKDDGLGTNGNLYLSGSDADKFELIPGSDSYIVLKPGTVLDYEAQEQFEVTVNVDDSTTESNPDSSVTYQLNVINKNEAPTISLQNTVTSISQSLNTAQKVADIVITDDALGTNDLIIGGVDADLFEIVDNSLYLKANIDLNAKNLSPLKVDVTVNDSEINATDKASLTISLTTNTLEVDNLVDENDEDYSDGDLSLREALQLVEDEGTISFAPNLTGETITLTEGELTLDRNLTIIGNDLTLSGDDSSRIFNINNNQNSEANVTLQGLNFTKGFTYENGGAIFNQENLTIIDSNIFDNQTIDDGGAIFNQKNLTLISSSLYNNTSSANGGAISTEFVNGTVNLSQVTISGNHGFYGGAIAVDGSIVNITNSTITNNTGDANSGIFSSNGGSNGLVTLTSSIVAGNQNNTDLKGSYFINGGHNVVGGNSDDYIGDNFDEIDNVQDSIDNSNFALLTDSVAKALSSSNGNGLPNDGFFAANSDHPEVQFAYPNGQNNARILNQGNSLNFSIPQDNYNRIDLFFLATEADSSTEIEFSYTDGTKETFTRTVPDWFNDNLPNDTYYLINNLDRAKGDSTGFEDSNNPAIFGLRFDLDVDKEVENISLSNTANNNSYLVFFGGTGSADITRQFDVSSVLNKDVIVNYLPTNPQLAPLRDNGSGILTHSLLPNSPAINTGSNPDNLTTDVRGLPRNQGSQIDIGALEMQLVNVDLDSTTEGINYNTTFVEDGKSSGTGNIAIVANPTITDADLNDSIKEIKVTLSNRLDGTAEGLSVNGTFGSIGTVQLSNVKEIILTGLTATHAEVENFLSAITYNNNSNTPNNNDRKIEISLSDGILTSPLAVTTVAITSANDVPTLTLENTISSIPENTVIATPLKVADLKITDDNEGTNNLIRTGIDADKFEIVGNELFLKAGTILDHETKNQLQVTVNLDDSTLGNTAESSPTLTIAISDVPEFPEINLKQGATNLPSGTTQNFGSLGINSGSTDYILTIENTGNAPLNVSNLTITGSQANDFAVIGNSPVREIAAGESLPFTIRFQPKGSGQRTATMTISNNDSNESIYTVNLVGAATTTKNMTGTDSDNIINSQAGDNIIDAGNGNDSINGGPGGEYIKAGHGNDVVNSQGGSDRIFGDEGNDSLDGGIGNDLLYGGKDRDRLFGKEGSDNLVGDEGDDYIDGGIGNDLLRGGTGQDTLVLTANQGTDTIYDFNVNEDKFELNGLAVNQLTFENNTTGSVIKVGSQIIAQVRNVTAAQLLDYFQNRHQ